MLRSSHASLVSGLVLGLALGLVSVGCGGGSSGGGSSSSSSGGTTARAPSPSPAPSSSPAGASPSPSPTPSVSPSPVSSGAVAGSAPASLPRGFFLGLMNDPTQIGWMQGSGVPWDARYQYLSAGVNTGNGWSTWNSPAGEFATLYLNASGSAGYLPVFSYYMLLQSSPSSGADEASRDLSNLANASTMNAYYADWKLLMQKCGTYGGAVLVHVEPDLWGYIEQQVDGGTNHAADVPASVASSGHADAAGLPDTAQGFALALLRMRDTYAPNVTLAIHLSTWGTKSDWSPGSSIDVTQLAPRSAAFLNSCGVQGNPSGIKPWDLFFGEFSDRDAGFYQKVVGVQNVDWQPADFDRYAQFLGLVNQATGLRSVLWQIPCGNTIFDTCNDTDGHYHDNRPQTFLEDYPANTRIRQYASAGVIGLLFGGGATGCTAYDDTKKDGVTNPPPIAGNSGQVSSHSDDDGGYLRVRGGAYYTAGKLTLP